MAQWVETSNVCKVKQGLWLPNGKCAKSEHGVVVHAQMQKSNGAQNLNKLKKINKLLGLENGLKWHEEEIQGYEDLLQGKRLLLEVATWTIFVVVTQNVKSDYY